VFKIEGTEEKTRLKVGPTQLNTTYTMIYLIHSKLAAIVDEGL